MRDPAAAPVDDVELPVDHPIVAAVGASAGGLEAFSQVMRALPADLGVAIVFLLHQAPQHESALVELLSAHSPLPVEQAVDGVRVAPDRIYVNPPSAELRIEGGKLRLTPRPSSRQPFLPIDTFFRSLATSAGEHSVAVVLSGTAADGSDGLRDVKAAGGIVITQQPESAKYDGMPRAAIATGLVDLVLPPDEIARSLARIGHHQSLRERSDAEDAEPEDRRAPLYDRIITSLRAGTGVDFRQYKRPTIERRVGRRMMLLRMTRLEQYARHLEQAPDEVQALFRDVLIQVTRFFRDPEVFDVVKERVFGALLEQRTSEDPIRLWVAGCATGEEAYSLAILLLEFLAERERSLPIQIFATDVSEAAIERAREGCYPATIAADVPPQRLRHYFVKTDDGYRITKAVRDLCIFARHDITRDPPFSRMDLIVCRNLLIYLNAGLQQRILALFHYTLKPEAFLLLGMAETVGQHSDLFRVEDKRTRLFAKKALSAPHVVLPASFSTQPSGWRHQPVPPARSDVRAAENEADRIIHERFAPPGVIVDADLHIVQFRGHTGLYLEHGPGDPSVNVLKMARDGLLYGLRTALHTARRTRGPVRRDGMRVRRDGGWQECAIEVLPLGGGERAPLLVLFHATGEPIAPVAPRPAGKRGARGRREHELELQIASLQRELAASREYLQPIIQELEGANEELQSANEEILSANEELQSTNEELDTAKEELQSTNEELNTVNDELRARNEELSQVNSDLENLLASVQIAIVIVAGDLKIRRFTPMAQRVLNLIPADLGRPISHIKPNIDCPDLEARIHHVLDTVTLDECVVSDRLGQRFSLRIRPYKDIENRIEGAVLALFELDEKTPRGSAGQESR